MILDEELDAVTGVLKGYDADAGYLSKAWHLGKKEYKGLETKRFKDQQPSEKFLHLMADQSIATSKRADGKTSWGAWFANGLFGGSIAFVMTGGGHGGKLLEVNFDHFSREAHAAYAAGHYVALKYANEAHNLKAAGQNAKAVKKLRDALIANGMSDHFLTDMFSAGHARTPRFELYAQCGQKVGGLYSNAQHDEENKRGVIMKNKNGDQWLALGDSKLWDTGDTTNRKYVTEAVAMSIRDVMICFKDGCPSHFSGFTNTLPLGALTIAPDLEHSLSKVEVGEPAPMFLLDDRCPATGRAEPTDGFDVVKGCNDIGGEKIPKIWRRTAGCKVSDKFASTASGLEACHYEELTCTQSLINQVESVASADRLPGPMQWLVTSRQIKVDWKDIETKFLKAERKDFNFAPFTIKI